MSASKLKAAVFLTYNGQTHRFGRHEYFGEGGACVHGCGIWEHDEHGFMKVPAGIDPHGACPGHYLGPNKITSGESLRDKSLRVRQDFIVNARIEMAEDRIAELESEKSARQRALDVVQNRLNVLVRQIDEIESVIEHSLGKFKIRVTELRRLI